VQTSAPNSINAWLCVHVARPVRGKSDSAIAHVLRCPREDFKSMVGAKARLRTRATFVSTNAARRS